MDHTWAIIGNSQQFTLQDMSMPIQEHEIKVIGEQGEGIHLMKYLE